LNKKQIADSRSAVIKNLRMKPTFYLILILFFCNLIVAQESFPNLDDKPSWKVVNTITSNPETKTLFEYQFEKDTLIKSVTYQKITNNAGYVRLLNDKVYYRLESNSKDFLLYDFGLNVNDTVYCGFNLGVNDDIPDSIKFWVVQVDSVTLEDGKHKRLQMHYNPREDYVFPMDWIEGIGSTTHPFYPSISLGVPGSIKELLCFHLGSTKIFQNSSHSDCSLTTSLNDVQKINNIQIYPNPCLDYFIVKGIEQGTILNVFNSHGQVILSNSIKCSELQVPTDNWGTGVYFVQVIKDNNSIFNQKITKQ
jgi:hypothetical protein